ncbi:MAG: hypothetical protein KAG10_02745 [Methylococcales bacterium]|nr:hypothetical protein [Methylococcales bacterium]
MKIKYSIGFRIFFIICWYLAFFLALGYIGILMFSIQNSGMIVVTGVFLLALVVQVNIVYVSRKHFIEKTHPIGQIITMLIAYTFGVPFVLVGGCMIILSGIGVH